MNRYLNNFIPALNGLINSPFVVFNNSGSVVASNKEAENLFRLGISESNIFSELTFETNSALNNLIESSYESGSSKSEVLNVIMKDGTSFTSRITVNTYKEDNAVFVILFAHPHENKIEINGITELDVKSAGIESIVKDENLINAIDEIRSLYPFTFIGKEKVLKTINKLDVLFWIKDIKGNFVLVNNKMAGGLGLKFSQIEGRHTQSFIQPFISEFSDAIDKYIHDSINSIVLKGLPVSGVVTDENYSTILIPLIDADEKVIATIGIGRKNEDEEKTAETDSNFTPDINLMDSLPTPAVIIGKTGFIEHYSQEFCKLLSINPQGLSGELYLNALPLKIAERIRNFIESDSLTENSELNFPEKGEDTVQYSVSLNKIVDNKGVYQGISVLLEKFNVDRNFENLIKRRGRMFEILIQNNPEPMFIYDTENLRFIEANDAALSLYGYRKDEFLQMDLTDLYTPEDIQTLLDSSSISAKEGKFTGPFKHKRKDGTFIFVEISKISFNYNDKNAHFNIIKDVTERLDLEKKNQLFRTAFENTGDLLFITDNVGLITFINNPVRTVLEYQKEELNSTSFSVLVRDEERGTLNSSIFQSHIKDTITLIMELKKSDGFFIETELTATPILDYKGEVDSFCIIAKKAADESEKPKEQVKEVIKEVVKEVIVEKPIPVETGGQGRNNVNFLSSLFHEILTPINVILGFVQEFTDNIENLTPEQKEAAEIINQNRDRLLNTMNSVIEFSSLEKGDTEVKPEEVAITEVIDYLYNEYKDIVGSQPVEFAYGKISSSLKFVTDKQKFLTLMSQLVKISAYINKEKKIYFSAYPYEEKYFVISIKDNYSFVSKYFLENLTGIFNREDFPQLKDFGISKLTLKLTHSLLELLNGRLEILEQGQDKVDYAFIFPVDLRESMPVEEVSQPEVPAEEPINEEQISDTEVISEEEVHEKTAEEEAAEEETAEEETLQEEVTDSEKDVDSGGIDLDSEEFGNIETENAEFHDQEVEEPQPDIVPEPEPDEELIAEPAEEFKEEEDVPDKIAEQVKPISKSMGSLNINSLNCLYIEDQVDSQILFKVQMKDLNDIKFAVSFEEALPLLDSNHFDFIVMDINLQGEYNGLDALKIIHKMPGYENIPIIAVTAYVLPGDKEKFIATGFNDFISKPIFREKMIGSLERIFLMQI